MHASEYYAQGIHGFFVGWGLDAIERHETAVTEPDPDRYRRRATAEDDDDFGLDGCTGCSCHLSAPCHHCENGHDGVTC
jgi:hypothetical protein